MNTAPIRILCCLHAVELGGVERAAMRLCRAMADDGADVLVALGRGDGWAGGEERLRVRIARRPLFSPRRFETLWMIWWLAQVIREERPDILYCAGNTYTIVAVAMWLRFGAQCPPIVAKVSNSLDRADFRGSMRIGYRWWCRLQGLYIDAFVAMTPAIATETVRIMRVSPARVGTIPNPTFDRATRLRLHAVPDRPDVPETQGRLFLAAGRLVRQKNFALLVEAFATGARPDDRLVILGEGPEHARLRRAIDAAGLADRVTLAGHRSDIAPWLSRADAVLLSSDYEGLPAIVIEALAAGRPVIATDCCASMAGLLADRRGRLVPPRDAGALAAAIRGFDPAEFDPAAARALAADYDTERATGACLRLFRASVRAPAVGIPKAFHA